jgi:hypothetical protein
MLSRVGGRGWVNEVDEGRGRGWRGGVVFGISGGGGGGGVSFSGPYKAY